MCLFGSKKLEAQKEDITCYKVLLRIFDGFLISPYMHGMGWEPGRTYHADGGLDVRKQKNFIGEGNSTNVFGGAFHTFKRKDDALKLASVILSRALRDTVPMVKSVVVVRCTIPKDTKYVYEGITETGMDLYPSSGGYASESLSVDEVVAEHPYSPYINRLPIFYLQDMMQFPLWDNSSS